MDTMKQGEVHIDVCVACGSRWFDRTEISTVVAKAVPGATLGWGERVAGDTSTATCPRCRTDTLLLHDYGPARFRRCTTCRGISIASQDLDAVLKSIGGPGSRLADIVREMFGA
jgi:Zn-finger nucleic acid-binding protein